MLPRSMPLHLSHLLSNVALDPQYHIVHRYNLKEVPNTTQRVSISVPHQYPPMSLVCTDHPVCKRIVHISAKPSTSMTTHHHGQNIDTVKRHNGSQWPFCSSCLLIFQTVWQPNPVEHHHH